MKWPSNNSRYHCMETEFRTDHGLTVSVNIDGWTQRRWANLTCQMPTKGQLWRHKTKLSLICKNCPFSISKQSIFISISIEFFIYIVITCIYIIYITPLKITLNAKITVIYQGVDVSCRGLIGRSYQGVGASCRGLIGRSYQGVGVSCTGLIGRSYQGVGVSCTGLIGRSYQGVGVSCRGLIGRSYQGVDVSCTGLIGRTYQGVGVSCTGLIGRSYQGVGVSCRGLIGRSYQGVGISCRGLIGRLYQGVGVSCRGLIGRSYQGVGVSCRGLIESSYILICLVMIIHSDQVTWLSCWKQFTCLLEGYFDECWLSDSIKGNYIVLSAHLSVRLHSLNSSYRCTEDVHVTFWKCLDIFRKIYMYSVVEHCHF
jgi:hypothetical protein